MDGSWLWSSASKLQAWATGHRQRLGAEGCSTWRSVVPLRHAKVPPPHEVPCSLQFQPPPSTRSGEPVRLLHFVRQPPRRPYHPARSLLRTCCEHVQGHLRFPPDSMPSLACLARGGQSGGRAPGTRARCCGRLLPPPGALMHFSDLGEAVQAGGGHGRPRQLGDSPRSRRRPANAAAHRRALLPHSCCSTPGQTRMR